MTDTIEKPALRDLVADLLADEELFGQSACCPVQHETGSNERLLLITGTNASGKSFVCKYLSHLAYYDPDGGVRKPVLEFMHLGMGIRTRSGMQKSLMFGDEDRESTGRVSLTTISSGFHNSENRTHDHILCFDEPDIGLSDEYQAAVGQYIAQFARKMPARLVGLIVVTHSRPIAKALYRLKPDCLRVGDDPRTTADWLKRPKRMSIDDLLSLPDRARARRHAIQAVQTDRQTGKS